MYGDMGDIENLNKAITLVERFLIEEGLEGLKELKHEGLVNEVELYYIPLMQKNLADWKTAAENITNFDNLDDVADLSDSD